MIRTVFTIANKVANHFRFSPTAIIEGRQPKHLEHLVIREQQYELQRQAQRHEFTAKIHNIADPFERQKEQIIYDFADIKSNLKFDQAWLKIDEVEQRQSDSNWKAYYEQKSQ